MTIIPMRDMKNTVEIERLCLESGGPVFVTKNGYGKLVVMDIDYYEKTMREIYEAKSVNEGLADLRDGKTIDGETAKNKLAEKLRETKEKDELFMKRAIEFSKLAVEHGNEPFGAVLCKNGEIVFESENRIYTEKDPTYHAENGLIRDFVKQTGITNLREYTLYSSCEPCFMCSGALVWTKLGRLVYGASNIDLENVLGKSGCDCSALVFKNSSYAPSVTAGVLREEAKEVLREYFKTRKKG